MEASIQPLFCRKQHFYSAVKNKEFLTDIRKYCKILENITTARLHCNERLMGKIKFFSFCKSKLQNCLSTVPVGHVRVRVCAVVPRVSPEHLRDGKHEGVMEDDAQGSSQKVRTKLARQSPEQEEAGALLLLQFPQELRLVWQSAA